MLGSTKLWQFTQTVPARSFGTMRCTVDKSLDQTLAAEPVRRVVRLLDHLVDVVEALRDEHRPEDLLAHDLHVRLHVDEHRGLHEVAGMRRRLAARRRRTRPACGLIRCTAARGPAAPSTPAVPSRSPGRGPGPSLIALAAPLTPSRPGRRPCGARTAASRRSTPGRS